MVQQGRFARSKAKDEEPYDINITIAKAIQSHTGKNITSFALLALHDDDSIFTQTSKDVEPWTESIFTIDAQQKLKNAHATGTTNGSVPLDNFDIVHPTTITTGLMQDVSMHGADTSNQSMSAPIRDRSSRHTSAVKRKVEQSLECPDQAFDSDKESFMPTTRHVEKFRIDDTVKVEQYIRNRLKSMQQLAVKRIAKAWIKGICPKKQAKFPYQNKKRERTEQLNQTDVPKWWPDVSVCRFIEPDHIKRKERLDLCLYLLRLRPDPNLLKSWNQGSVEPHHTHVAYGWTQFLEELAPASILSEMREPDKKTQRRQQSLKELYHVALMEQEYQQGGIDGDTIIERYPEEEKPVAAKKTKLSAVPDSDSEDDSSIEGATRSPTRRSGPNTNASSSSSTVCSDSIARIEPISDDFNPPLQQGVSEAMMQDALKRVTAMAPRRRPRNAVLKREPAENNQINAYGTGQQFLQLNQWANPGFAMNGGWSEDISPAQSFVSSQDAAFTPASAQSFTFDNLPYSRFPSQQNFSVPQADSKPALVPEHGGYPTHSMNQITQQHFSDTVPNTPTLSPANNFLGGLPADQMHNVHNVYRPNGFPTHGLPLEHTPHHAYSMSAAQGTNLTHYDPHAPQQHFVHPSETQRHHSDAGYVNMPFLN